MKEDYFVEHGPGYVPLDDFYLELKERERQDREESKKKATHVLVNKRVFDIDENGNKKYRMEFNFIPKEEYEKL